jgi:hypothetical protein
MSTHLCLHWCRVVCSRRLLRTTQLPWYVGSLVEPTPALKSAVISRVSAPSVMKKKEQADWLEVV